MCCRFGERDRFAVGFHQPGGREGGVQVMVQHALSRRALHVCFAGQPRGVVDSRVTVASIRAVLPVQARGCWLVFVLATLILVDWGEYAHMMVRTLHSVRLATSSVDETPLVHYD